MNFKKRGNSSIETINRGFEVVLPIIAFVAILGVIWHIGSDRSAQAYFQTVEFSNIIDAAATFDGQLRLKYVPIAEDFLFTLNPTSFTTQVPKSKRPTDKPIHIPTDMFVDNRINTTKNKPIRQVQFLKTRDAISVGAFSNGNFANYIYTKDQQICPTADERQTGYVEYNNENLPKDILVTSTITKGGLIFVDTSHIENIESGVKQQFIDRLGIAQASSANDAKIIIVLHAKPSTTPSVLIFAPNEKETQRFACILTTKISPKDQDTSALTPTLVATSHNPYSKSNTKVIDIDLFYNKDNTAQPISPYVPTITQAIKAAYYQVYNE